MKKESEKNRKTIVIIICVFVIAVIIIATVMKHTDSEEEEASYGETAAEYDSSSACFTREGAVSVGTVEQSFDLDMSQFSSGNGESGHSFQGPMSMNRNAQTSGGTRQLEVEEVYAAVGTQIGKGDPLFKLTAESVEKIREELVSDEEDARLACEELTLQQQKAMQEASQVYEQNLVYGNAAAFTYEESLYELQKAAQDALEELEEAQSNLQEDQEDLLRLREEYEEAKRYVAETTAAVESEEEVYWYLQNEESREQAKKTAEDEEEEIERLEDSIWEQEQQIVLLKAAYDEAQRQYLLGEADAGTEYDKRIYYLDNAEEIYHIAVDKIDYEVRTAKEDYEDASEKLRTFDDYITDGIVCAEYEGSITGVSISAGDKIKSGAALITVNNYEDITVKVEVDDDDIRSIAVGDAVTLSFMAFPEGSFTGTVSGISDAVIGSGSDITYEVEIAVSGDVNGLYEGMTCSVTFGSAQQRTG